MQGFNLILCTTPAAFLTQRSHQLYYSKSSVPQSLLSIETTNINISDPYTKTEQTTNLVSIGTCGLFCLSLSKNFGLIVPTLKNK